MARPDCGTTARAPRNVPGLGSGLSWGVVPSMPSRSILVCGGGDCVLGRGQPVSIVTGIAGPGVFALDESAVYYSFENSLIGDNVARCPLTGCVGLPNGLMSEDATITALENQADTIAVVGDFDGDPRVAICNELGCSSTANTREPPGSSPARTARRAATPRRRSARTVPRRSRCPVGCSTGWCPTSTTCTGATRRRARARATCTTSTRSSRSPRMRRACSGSTGTRT